MLRFFTLRCALLLGLLASPVLAAPDTLLSGRFDADEFPSFNGIDSPGFNNQKVEIWIGADRARSNQGKFTLILRLDQKRLYTLDPARKVYAVEELKSQGKLLVRAQALGFAATFSDAEAQEMVRPHLSLTPTDETQKIGAWQTQRVTGQVASQLQSGRYRVSWWFAPEVKIDDLAYRQLILLNSPELEPLFEHPGFPVVQEIFVQMPDFEVKSKIAIEKVETREAPAGTYDPPAGFRRVALPELTGLPSGPP